MVRGGGGGRSFLALDSPGTVLVATARDPAIYEYAGAMRQATNEWASGALPLEVLQAGRLAAAGLVHESRVALQRAWLRQAAAVLHRSPPLLRPPPPTPQ